MYTYVYCPCTCFIATLEVTYLVIPIDWSTELPVVCNRIFGAFKVDGQQITNQIYLKFLY